LRPSSHQGQAGTADPAPHRLEALERIGGQGEVVRPLDPASVVAVAARLLAAGIARPANCFINGVRRRPIWSTSRTPCVVSSPLGAPLRRRHRSAPGR
jgi:hypothetical protein